MPPATPANVRVVDRGADFIAWQWDPVSGAVGYHVQVSIGDDDFAPPDDEAVLSADQTVVRLRSARLESGTTVYVRVRAVSGTQAAPVYGQFSSPVSGMTTGVAPPRDDHGDTQGTATRVGSNSSTPGELEVSGDVDFFRLAVPSSGGYLTIETTGPTDTVGTLHLPDSTTRSDHDGGGVDPNFRIATGFVRSGTYFVEVSGFGGAIGSYVLRVRFDETGPGASRSGQILVDDLSLDLSRSTADQIRNELTLTPEQDAILDRIALWEPGEPFVLGCETLGTYSVGNASLHDFIAAVLRDSPEPELVAHLFSHLDFLDSRIRASDCAVFLDRDGVEWTGEHRRLEYPPLGSFTETILVWGTPRTGYPLRSVARTQWWVDQDATSFANPAPSLRPEWLDQGVPRYVIQLLSR